MPKRYQTGSPVRGIGRDIRKKDYILDDGDTLKENSKTKYKTAGYTLRGYGRPMSKAQLGTMFTRIPQLILDRLVIAGLPRNALVMALLLQRQADMRGWSVVRLPTAILNHYRFDRRTVARALQQLETAELVRVHRKAGRRSSVTVLWRFR
jgi:hypothetical protein